MPQIHRITLGLLTVITFAATIWPSYVYQFQNNPGIKNTALETSLFRIISPLKTSKLIDTDTSISDDEFPQDELNQKGVDEENEHEYIVSSGDTLGSILIQYDIEMSDIAILAAQHHNLRNIKIGQQLSWTLNAKGNLKQLKWVVSRREIRIYNRIGNRFKETQQWQHGEWHNSIVYGRLSGDFISSTYNAGLTHTEIKAVIRALQWQLDFQNLNNGDTFSVLMSREHFCSKKTQSQLLAVRIRTRGKDYYAIRAEDGKFYDLKGYSLARSFMRFPTMKTFRISSSFNPRRVNPVTGRIAPHKGVDFAMPIDTPVIAVGDGEVLIAKYSRSAGYYMVIRHNRQYITRYMHLKNLLVKSGQKVKCGERIALSGNSGRSTGPHLHFELWINKEAVNPLTVKLPHSKSLIGKERANYLEHMNMVISQLKFH